MADKIASVFVPVVMSVSFVTFVVWMLVGGGIYSAVNYAVSVLVISCPCALGLATPVAIMVATGKGAQYGILLKDGATLENLCKVSCVVTDKTGTVTTGKPHVVTVDCTIDKSEFVSVVASVEKRSEHPLGNSVVAYAKQSNLATDIDVKDYQTRQGLGVVANVDGDSWAIGNNKLMNELSVDIEPVQQALQDCYDNALTVLIVAKNGICVGVIGVGDEIKPTSELAVNNLKKLGIKTVLLTGDNACSAQSVCGKLGIDDYVAEVLPDQKADKITELAQSEFVAMVGDGINDAPALACANVGFAVASGTDIALDTADVLLVNSNLNDVPTAIALSAKTTKIIKQNLFWAFAYNTLGIPIAAGVFAFAGVVLNPMIASLCMSLSSLFVVTNALRINNFKAEQNFDKQVDVAQMCQTDVAKETSSVESKEGVTMKFAVEGMMCMHCVKHVTDAIKSLSGVEDVVVSLESNSAVVTGSVTADEVIDAVTNEGYSAKLTD